MFWIAAISLAVLAAAAVLLPLFAPVAAAAQPRARHDADVYAAQLRELTADVERGALPRGEAEAARAEIGRRLLRAEAEVEAASSFKRGKRRGAVGFAAVLVAAIFAGAGGLYLRLGQPGVPDMPLAARGTMDPGESDIRTLVAAAEARLRTDPEDGRGWDALAPIYMRLGRADEAAAAAGNAIRLLGSSAPRETLRGEALTLKAGGVVTPDATDAFRTALRAEPANAVARYYLAMALSQAGRTAEAATAWQAMLDAGPADAPWMPAVRNALATVRPLQASPPAPGPSAADVAAAANLSDEGRAAMIRGMVAQLAGRLETAPNDPDGWRRLIRSHLVLGEPDEALDALRRAQKVFPLESAERRSIDEFAAGLGLGDSRATP